MRLIFATLCTGLLSAQTSSNPLDALAVKYAAANYREYIELLAIPNVSSVPADIQKNAAFLDAAFQKRGFKTTIWPNNGRPLLFAESTAPHPEKKTVLFYMHMDGQPVTPSEWHQESPSVDARRVGLRPTRAYWGGANEQIDVLSGNVNFTIHCSMPRAGMASRFPSP